MINAKDLRIGNIIQRDGNIVVVGWGTLKAMNEGIDIGSPIPLTDEWMLKFGFEKHEKNHGAPIGGNYTDFYFDGYVFNQDVSGAWYLSGYNWNTKHFAYVHELQNLFFALSGYELEIVTPETKKNKENEMPTIERKKINSWDSLVFTDENTGDVCITFAGEGGAIIGAKNYADAESRFIDAMNLAESLRKLLYFKEYGKF
jgi:hypothetical protein